MNRLSFFTFLFCLFPIIPAGAQDASNLSPESSGRENRWVAPAPLDENDRIIKFNFQADYQQDADIPGQAFSVFDMSAKRKLDENSVFTDGLLRVRKSLSTSDAATDVDLRLLRISYLEPWLQVSVGRFDIFQTLTPNLFFGSYPTMGIHRADGILVTVPFSFFFKIGEPQNGEKAESSPPLAASFFYTPSLFSAQQVQYDATQSFWLSQLRFRIEGKDYNSTVRVNLGGSSSNFFDYSSLNGNLTGSLSAELDYKQNYSLTAEYGVQNLQLPADTSALALGFQAARLGTWGDFSLDQIALEGQFPLSYSLSNPFTGGNGITPALAGTPQNCWYLKVKTRLKIIFIELHVTNNQNDFTLSRLNPAAANTPFSGSFGPGNETDGPGTPLRATSYKNLAYLVRVGVEF